ncbi:hypothetical protein [Leptolyngbya sp. FACHB-261]|uniref:hypothetical protein n=1 Tax=Leptolyngbya sp. FACHB-261 TaxID=2692806 RepID=UPI00168597B1|nr:hypothetical protein [Leptolyngbya sp. FACHB-261]MBD2104947.1 hypothetical protein [Leptolyngbya sp. FACHB-261]
MHNMPECKVFYSWQSDLPNSTNRGFIEKALENAVKSIRNDESIEVEPVVDRDTTGVPGSPDIASTIFAKIEQTHIFVCDISIINSGSQFRPTPNPNVLIELGYAIKTLGPERIVMIMNTAFGVPEHLPFDLRMRRVITYKIPEAPTEKASERRQLETKLVAALDTIFTDHRLQTVGKIIQPISIGEQARIAVENTQPNQEVLTRKFMTDLVERLDSIAPSLTEVVSDQMIIDAIGQTIELGVEFSHLAEAIASMSALNAATAMYRGFEEVLNRYGTPTGFAGSFYKQAFDFYKFVGHEFFVMFFSFLIREEQWEIITKILDEDLYVERPYDYSKPDNVPFTYICSPLDSLENRRQRLNLNTISVHADLLNERHTQGDLAEVVPMQQFINADCFLFLRAELQPYTISAFSGWAAWSIIYVKQPPRYLIEAYRIKNAQKLLAPLKMDNVEMLRDRMIEITPKLDQAFRQNVSLYFRKHPLGDFSPQDIGSRQ